MAKSKTQFSKEDIGKLYTTDGKDVWTLTDYIPEPQVTMTIIIPPDGSATGGIKEGLLSEFKDFVPLVPKVKPPLAPKRKWERHQKPQEKTEAT